MKQPPSAREDIALLAKLLAERNRIESKIARLIDRPVERGHLGEFIASRIFSIELESSAAHKGSDGHFRRGPRAGRSVNIKVVGKREGLLDLGPPGAADYYLVLAGPRGQAGSSQGQTRPFQIDAVYLFDGEALHADLSARGIKTGIATSVMQALWEAAEIYPEARNAALMLGDEQTAALAQFRPPG